MRDRANVRWCIKHWFKRWYESVSQSEIWQHVCVGNQEILDCSNSNAWENKSNLKPEIVFQDMDIKYKNETPFLVYLCN